MSVFASLVQDFKTGIGSMRKIEVTIHLEKTYKTKLFNIIIFCFFLFLTGIWIGLSYSTLSIVKEILSAPVFASIVGAFIIIFGYHKIQQRMEIIKLSKERLLVISQIHCCENGAEDFIFKIINLFSKKALDKFYMFLIEVKLGKNALESKKNLLIHLNSEVFYPFEDYKKNPKSLDEFYFILSASKEELLKRQILKSDIFICETDTIPGIFCQINNDAAVKKIYSIKGRNFNKPLAIYSFEPLKYAQKNDLLEAVLIELRGLPVTLVCKGSSLVPNFLLKDGFVGLRIMKEDSKLLSFLRENNLTLAGTSANFSSSPSPKSIKEVDPKLIKELDILELGEAPSMQESCVLKLENNKITILRHGLGMDQILAFIKAVNGIEVTSFEGSEEKQSYIINLKQNEE